MSAPTELNMAMNEVPVPEIIASNEEAIIDMEALQCEAQKTLDVMLAVAKAKNEEIMHKWKEKEEQLEAEQKQVECYTMAALHHSTITQVRSGRNGCWLQRCIYLLL